MLYGGGSPGGLVNIQSKKPQKASRTEVGFNTGTRNLKEGYLDSTGKSLTATGTTVCWGKRRKMTTSRTPRATKTTSWHRQ
ncbi:hypothetical protein ACP3P6_18215 [Enterobacter mori]